MRSERRAAAAHLAAAALCCALLPSAAVAGSVDPALAAQVARARQLGPRPLTVIVELDGRPDVAALERSVATLPEARRAGALAAQLRARFEQAAPPVREALLRLGATEVEPLWLAHGFAATLAPKVVDALARTPGVARVYADVALKAPATRLPSTAEALRARRIATAREASAPAAAKKSEPGVRFEAAAWRGTLPAHLSAVGAAEWWQRGRAGQGVTVAVVDSGVDGRDPALMSRYRGGPGDWFDPFGQRRAPVDGGQHGSHVARLIVGAPSRADAAPDGVAPQARWIAARIYDDAGVGRLSAIHRIHQWLLDPDGRPETDDAPQIVNNSWALPQTAGRCDREFERDFALLRAARIHVLFAAGNEGPAPDTSVSPSNNAGVIAVGALGPDGAPDVASSRGPSACTGSHYPQLMAPGVALESRDVAARMLGATDRVSGTSFAVALASGLLALIASDDAAASFEAREQRLAAALAGGLNAARTDRPVELAWSPTVAPDGSLTIDADALRAVLPWNARLVALATDDSPEGTPRVDLKAAAQATLAPFTLLARADDGRRWRIAVTPRHGAVDAAPAQPRLTLAVRGGATATLGADRLAATLAGAPAQPLSVRASQSSRGARVVVQPDGAVQYTARRGFRGVDQFICEVAAGDAPPTRVSVSVYVN
jgi:subtilisin family serine protease